MHRQNIHAIPAPQPQRPQRPAHHPAARRDEDLHGLRLHGTDLVDPPQGLVALKAQQLGHLRAKHHAVPDPQFHTFEIAPKRGIPAHHVDKPHAVAFEKLDPGDLAPDEVRVRRDHGLGKELHLRPVRQQRRHRVSLRQQPWCNQAEVEHAPDHHDEADGRDFEDRERRQPLRPRHAVHQQVRRRPQKRQCAAHDRRV